MTKIPELHPLLRAWLLEGPLSAQVQAYVARLRRGRYATHTSGRCLNGVAHFAHWMSMCHLPARMLDERFTTAAALRAVKAMEGSTLASALASNAAKPSHARPMIAPSSRGKMR